MNELARKLGTSSDDYKQFLSDNQIEFNFNAPGPSHAGGVWECQIRTIRSVMDGMSHSYKRKLDTVSLRAEFYVAKSIANCRPLAVDNLNKPSKIVLTPNHLITMKTQQTKSFPGKSDLQEIY